MTHPRPSEVHPLGDIVATIAMLALAVYCIGVWVLSEMSEVVR